MRSASLGLALRARELAKSCRPASDSERHWRAIRTTVSSCSRSKRSISSSAFSSRRAWRGESVGSVPLCHAARSRAISSSTWSMVIRPRAGDRAHPHHGATEVPEVPGPGRLGRRGEAQEALPGLLVEGDSGSRLARMALQLVVEVGRDVLTTLAERGQAERPQIDARQEILAKAAGANQIVAGRGWCRRSTGSRCRRRDRPPPARTASPPAPAGASPAHPARAPRSRRARARRHRPASAGPARSWIAPVNAPFTWPKRADMAPSPRSVAQLTSTNGPWTCRRAFLSA